MHQEPKEELPIGTPVWFLPRGQATDEPLPATIIKISKNLIARISYIDPDGGVGYKSACYPFGSDALKDPTGKPTYNAINNGAWTYHPMFAPRKKTTKSST